VRRFFVHYSPRAIAAKKKYEVRVDESNRVTIHAKKNSCYHAVHLNDGSILLTPADAKTPVSTRSPRISERTLRGMDAAIANLRAGKRSEPVDLKKLAALKL
jgi:hypothetical protein